MGTTSLFIEVEQSPTSVVVDQFVELPNKEGDALDTLTLKQSITITLSSNQLFKRSI